MTDEPTMTALKRLDAAERSYVREYDRLVERISDPYVRQQIEECQRSHQMRCDILREEIEDLGGEVDEAKTDPQIVIADSVFGEEASIKAMHGLEETGLAAYRRACAATGDGALDFDVRDLVEGDLLPEQERAEAIMRSLVADVA